MSNEKTFSEVYYTHFIHVSFLPPIHSWHRLVILSFEHIYIYFNLLSIFQLAEKKWRKMGETLVFCFSSCAVLCDKEKIKRLKCVMERGRVVGLGTIFPEHNFHLSQCGRCF